MAALLLGAALVFDWVVMGAGGVAVARTAVERPGAACPPAQVDGAPLVLRARFRGGPGFAVTICEAALPAGAKQAAIDGRALPLPKAAPAKMVALGDTGCRIKRGEDEDGEAHFTIQNCANVPGKDELDQWPLQKLAEQAAALKPDLVIHLGDFIYRKAACPAGEPRCAGSSAFGTSWETLKAEFLEPARVLLKAAPWVMVRGNHESCAAQKDKVAQGGVGFFLLFDPRPLDELVGKPAPLADYLSYLAAGGEADARQPATCAETTPSYAVPAGNGLELWVLDSNAPMDGARGPEKHPDLVAHFARELRTLQAAATARGVRHAILLTHRPLYALFAGSRSALPEDVEAARPVELNVILQQAFEDAGRTPAVELVLAGHMHTFQALSFADGLRPPTLVVGNSGTALDRYLAEIPAIADLSIREYLVAHRQPAKVSGFTLNAFGFLSIERDEVGLLKDAKLHGMDGGILASCALRATGGKREAQCAINH